MLASVMVMENTQLEHPVFAANLPLKLFRATVASTDIGGQKFLHIFLTTTGVFKTSFTKL